MIKFTNVSKHYENSTTAALNNVSLEINQGEFLFIVGKSGAGKSTLTKLMIGETKPTGGEIQINNFQVDKLKQSQIPYFRRTIGMVFQDFRLLEDKTVLENIAFAMQIIGANSRQVRRSVPDVLSRVGLSSKAKRYPHELSGGEQQRVAIARALVNNPSLIIADEPTGNLDHNISIEILNMLEEINRGGTTVIVVTHDKELVNIYKKRVLAIENGKIISDEERGVYYEDIILS